MALRQHTDKKIYSRIFLALACSIAITVAISSMILYVNFKDVSLEQVYLANLKSLEQVNDQVLNMANIASTVSDQIYHDAAISKLLFYDTLDIYDYSNAIRELTSYRLSLQFIDSIYVYNGKTKTFYSEPSIVIDENGGLYDKGVVEIVNNYKLYKPYAPIPRKIIDPYDKRYEKFLYTFPVYERSTDNQLSSAVIINISDDWISKELSEDKNSGSQTYIIDSNGTLVSEGGNYPMLFDFSHKSYYQKISADEEGGYFIDRVDGENSLVVYTKIDKFGWRSVRIIHWSTLFSKIESIRTVAILVVSGILLMGILAAIFVSRRLYNPIGKIIKNLEHLEFEKKSNIKLLKEEFLSNLLLGKETVGGLRQKKQDFRIDISFESQICVLLIRIDQYHNHVQKFDNEDRNLYKFAIMNIACEILGKYKAEAVDTGKDAVAVIIEYPGSQLDGSDKELDEQIKLIQNYILKYLEFSVTITVSTTGENMEALNQLYDLTVEASVHKLFSGNNSIIYAYQIIKLKSKEYTYPISKEKLLIDCLMAGQTAEAIRVYDEIIREVSMYSITVFNHALSHLLFSLNNTINTIKSNNSLDEDDDFSIPLFVINDAETLDEINRKFYDLFSRLEQRLEERKSSKLANLVARINERIQSHYGDSSLSIDSIADCLGVSSAYICRIYKQLTLHTILDEIVEVRMNKARELLIKTKHPIEEIAGQTGFSSSNYFYKSFKAANGTTPSKYRQIHKQ